MKFKRKARNEYDYYNLIEKCILDMETDERLEIVTAIELRENCINRDELKNLV